MLLLQPDLLVGESKLSNHTIHVCNVSNYIFCEPITWSKDRAHFIFGIFLEIKSKI